MHTGSITSVWLFAAWLLAAVPGAAADPFPSDNLGWLKTTAFAAHQTNYTGTFVYQYGNHVETSRITHIFDRDGEHVRLEGLDGVRREIIQSNGQVLCYMGDRQVSVQNHPSRRSFPALLPEQLTLLSENYLIKEAEEARVAGFHTHAFIFQPKDRLRYTHKMWVDSDSGLLLKAAVLDERGRIVEQYAFTQLSIGGEIDRKWIEQGKPAPSFHAQHPYSAAPLPKTNQAATVSGWQVGLLPSGFKKTAEVLRPMSGRKSPVAHLVFSDGLAGVSVFIEDIAADPEVRAGLSGQGAIQIYSKVSGRHRVTVVGEAPPRTVMQIAGSVRYREQ